jgi:hypothetical protein
MRTTIEVPDEVLREAKSRAAISGVTLKQFFILSIQESLAKGGHRKVRKDPPVLGDADAKPPLKVLNPEEMDDALWG